MSNTLRLPPKARLTAKPAKANAKPAKAQKKKKLPKATVEQQARKQAEVEARTRREVREAIERRAAARAANLATLAERFPAVFGNAAKPLPLAIRCNKVVREAAGATWSQGEDLMFWWTHRVEYFAALAAGGPRYNIDGTENGEVSERQRELAATQLRTLERALSPRQRR
jgi:hypothetical protein